MLFWVLISVIVCLKTTESDAQDSERSGFLDSDYFKRSKATPCQTKDNESGYCLSVVRCRRIMPSIRRFRNPNICFFENELPHVCCPVKVRGQRPTNSNPIPASRPVTTSTRRPNRPSVINTPRPSRSTTTTTRRPTTTRRSTSTTRRQNGPMSSSISATEINSSGCGKRAYFPSQGSAFVVGGEEAPRHAWPWMAGIRVKTFGDNSRFMCGGSLISRRHILTAAHCFGQGGGSRPPSDFKVILGSHSRGSDRADSLREEEKEEGAISVTVRAIRVHEDYKDNGYDNDIAVLLLDEVVPVNDFINLVCLPTRPGDRSDPNNVTIIGWGDLSFGGIGSKTLQQANFKVVPLSRCRRIFRQLPAFSNGITSNMLCAGDLTGEKDACQNDSGGPLLTENVQENKWTQVGIVSFGYRCAERGFPGVYSRLTSYVPWIQRTVRRLQ